MRNVLKIAVVIACLAAIPSVALAATKGKSGKPFAINCYREQFKPKRITIACGDAGTWLAKLKWSKWSGSSARGVGFYKFNTCKPFCAAGKIKSFRVEVTLSKVKRCPGQAHPAFRHATLTYRGRRPKGAPAKINFRCPPRLPGGY